MPQYATAPATVRAYYSAINSRNYARAWHLGGRFTGSSYSAFAAGFQGTAHDEVSILSVTGSVVTARLAARQTDGSVRNYQGTYWVTHGVITRFAVAPSSAASHPRRRPLGRSGRVPSDRAKRELLRAGRVLPRGGRGYVRRGGRRRGHYLRVGVRALPLASGGLIRQA